MLTRLLGTGRLSLIALVLISLPLPAALAKDPSPLSEVAEPTRAELLDKANLDPKKPEALVTRLKSLLSDELTLADVWLPTVRRSEHQKIVSTARELGYGEKRGGSWATELPKMKGELATRKLVHPARLCDAILRQLEETGTPDQIEFLLEYATAQNTEWGRWKFYATVQGILGRYSAAEIVKHNRITPVLAMLLRDLTPAQRSSLAFAFLERERLEPDALAPPLPKRTELWLGWSLGSTRPEAALPLLKRGLDSSDPAIRLFAGLGIAAISDSPIPFCLTADRKTTESPRTAWLKDLKLRWADDYRFVDPLDDFAMRKKRGDTTLTRSEEEPILRVLPDGTCYSGRSKDDQSVALTNRDGEVLVRFPDGRYNCQDGSLAPHGGFWALGDRDRLAIEYAVNGEKLWECPLIDGHASARFIAGGGPGQVLLLRYNRLEILNRRGDVVWSIAGKLGDDPRWACMVDPDTVLIANKTRAELHHRTKGLFERMGGPFHSLDEIRYHPEKPWMMFDGGNGKVEIYDPLKKTSVTRSLAELMAPVK